MSRISSIACGVLALEELEDGAVLAVDREDAGAALARRLEHERTAGDEALLVGQRQGDASAQSREGGAQAGGADDGVEHDQLGAAGLRLGLGRLDELLDALVAGEYAAGARGVAHGRSGRQARQPFARLGGALLVAHGEQAHAELLGLLQQAVDVGVRPKTRDAQTRRGRDDLERLAADGPGRAEHDHGPRRAASRALLQS